MEHQINSEQIIQQKLNEITPPDVSALWEEMEARLDQEMPQKEKKKSGFIFWGISVSLLIAGSVFASYMDLLWSSSEEEKVTSTVTVEKRPQASAPNHESVGNYVAQPVSAGTEPASVQGAKEINYLPGNKQKKPQSYAPREKSKVLVVPPIKQIAPVKVTLPAIFQQQQVKPVSMPAPEPVHNFS